MPEGYCQCGCGKETSIAKYNNSTKGWVKGQPVKFIWGHHSKLRIRSNNPNWKGGKYLRTDGYVFILKPNHPRADCYGYIQEHILVAEKALGKYLPDGVVVHHINGIKSDNQNNNLIICNNNTYHILGSQEFTKDIQKIWGNKMPIYLFHCEFCNFKFEILTIRANWDGVRCPKCNKSPRKLLTSANFVVKGANIKNLYGLKGKDVS